MLAEMLRNYRRALKLGEWFLKNNQFLQMTEDKPYLIPDVKIGATPRVEISSDDGVKLFRYEPRTEKQFETPVLIVYALINKPYILDLTPQRSVVRKLLDAGFNVYMLRWGDATIADQFSLDSYIDIFLYDFIEDVKSDANVDKVTLLGYCMGGGMSAIYTALYPENVRNIIFLASTLYFEKEGGGLVTLSDKRFFNPEEVVAPFGYVPSWFLTERFKILEPWDNYVGKYINLFLNAEDESFLDDFFRMERWIHDGVNVAPGAYVRYNQELYQNNALAEGKLYIRGKRVDPKRITMPAAAIVGLRDHLAPPDCTLKFLDRIGSKDKAVFKADVGHVGLVVSRRGMALWDDVAKWLSQRSGELKRTKEI
ncbi:MAG: PHA/PHB synthase family protein [Archaeoglobaceae archaeon]